MPEYKFKTEPRKHQLESFLAHRDDPSHNLWWRMGLGKTKDQVDTMCYLYQQKKVQAAVVLAPPGVERNWVNIELKKHAPIEYTGFFWTAKKAKQKGNQKEQVQFMQADGFKVLTISYPAMLTPLAFEYVKAFMKKHVCVIVLDESQKIKTPGGKTTIRVNSLSTRAPYKRGLSGSPITKAPFDIYSQVRFTHPSFWAQHNLYPFATFKSNFATYLTRQECIDQCGYDPGYDKLLEYKNLGRLESLLTQVGHRLTLKSAGLDLPEIIYTQRLFELTPKVKKVYDTLAKKHMVTLPESGSFLAIEHNIAVQAKLQQVACGYVGVEQGEPWEVIDSGRNPRLEALLENIKQLGGKAIIWSKFTRDIDEVMTALLKAGRKPVRYDGKVDADQRVRNLDAFQNGDATDMVAKPRSAGTGLQMTAAESIHHYAASYDYDERIQADARAHRWGLDHGLVCVDYIAVGTLDEGILPNLRAKDLLSKELLGDKIEAWL